MLVIGLVILPELNHEVMEERSYVKPSVVETNEEFGISLMLTKFNIFLRKLYEKYSVDSL